MRGGGPRLAGGHDPDFDARVCAGERPTLEFYISGQTHALRRVEFAVATLDMLRAVKGDPAPVEVVFTPLSDRHARAWSLWKILFWTVFALNSAGVLVPAMLVEERESRTLDAVLVTGTTLSEVMVAKAVLGAVMAFTIPFAALVINGALLPRPFAFLSTLVVAALLSTEIGFIIGTVSKNTETVGALAGALHMLAGGTMVFSLGLNGGKWIAKLVPTYWVIGPLYRVIVEGAGLADVSSELGVALAIAAALAVVIVFLGRRMKTKLASD